MRSRTLESPSPFRSTPVAEDDPQPGRAGTPHRSPPGRRSAAPFVSVTERPRRPPAAGNPQPRPRADPTPYGRRSGAEGRCGTGGPSRRTRPRPLPPPRSHRRRPSLPSFRPSFPAPPPPLTSFGLSSGANRLMQGNGELGSLPPAPRCGQPSVRGELPRARSPRRGGGRAAGEGSDPPHGQPGSSAAPRHFCFPRRRSWCIVGAQRAAAPPRRAPPAPTGSSAAGGRGERRRGGRTQVEPNLRRW